MESETISLRSKVRSNPLRAPRAVGLVRVFVLQLPDEAAARNRCYPAIAAGLPNGSSRALGLVLFGVPRRKVELRLEHFASEPSRNRGGLFLSRSTAVVLREVSDAIRTSNSSYPD